MTMEPTNDCLARPDADEPEVARRLVSLFLGRLAAQEQRGSSLCLLSASIGSCPAMADCRGPEFGRVVHRLVSTSVLYGQLFKPARVL